MPARPSLVTPPAADAPRCDDCGDTLPSHSQECGSPAGRAIGASGDDDTTALSSPTIKSLAAAIAAWLTLALTQYRGPGAASLLRALVLADVCPVPVNVIATGAPGTGKTAMSAAWAAATCGLPAFLPVTFSPWTDPAEFLGAVDITALAAGTLKRSTNGKRPTVENAALMLADELPRGSPATRAAMLPILSDRVTPTWDVVTAWTIIAGANTRLTSEEDRALVDRFALKVDVPRLANSDDLRAVIGRNVPVDGARPTAAPLPKLPAGAVATLRAHASTVDVPGDVLDALTSLALALRQPSPTGASYPDVSERRWVIATRLLQSSAALRGASVVDWSDFTSVLPLVLDDGEDSRVIVAAAITSSVPQWVASLSDLDNVIANAKSRAYRVGGVVNMLPPVDGKGGDAHGHARLDNEFDAILATIQPYGPDVVKRAEERIDLARDVIDAEHARGVAENKARRAKAAK